MMKEGGEYMDLVVRGLNPKDVAFIEEEANRKGQREKRKVSRNEVIVSLIERYANHQFESEMNRKYEALVREVLVSLKANTDSNQQVRIVLDTLMNFEEEIENA